jgi:hypothetical protein
MCWPAAAGLRRTKSASWDRKPTRCGHWPPRRTQCLLRPAFEVLFFGDAVATLSRSADARRLRLRSVASLTGPQGRSVSSSRPASRSECRAPRLRRLKPPERGPAAVGQRLRHRRQGDAYEAPDIPAAADADTRRVNGDGPKQGLDLASPLITHASKLQAVPAHPCAGGERLYLGLKDQTALLAEQVLPLRQRLAHFLPAVCRTTRHSSPPTSMVSASAPPLLASSLATHSMTAPIPQNGANFPDATPRAPELLTSPFMRQMIPITP